MVDLRWIIQWCYFVIYICRYIQSVMSFAARWLCTCSLYICFMVNKMQASIKVIITLKQSHQQQQAVEKPQPPEQQPP